MNNRLVWGKKFASHRYQYQHCYVFSEHLKIYDPLCGRVQFLKENDIAQVVSMRKCERCKELERQWNNYENQILYDTNKKQGD